MGSPTLRRAVFALGALVFVLPQLVAMQQPTEVAKLVGTGAGQETRFGWSVLAVDPATVLVGAIGRNAVYVYEREPTGWTERGLLPTPNEALQLGASLAVDGDTVVVGANLGNGAEPFTGTAYAFVRSGTDWTLQGSFIPSDGKTQDQFGDDVAVEGDLALVGAPQHDAGAQDAGAVYVYTRAGTVWSQAAKLVAAAPGRTFYFGDAVATRGGTIFVGAVNEFAVHVFSPDGTGWAQRAPLVPNPPAPLGFGSALAVDGGTLVAGARHGVAHVFVGAGSTWTVQARLAGSSLGPGGGTFGYAVAVEGDRALVGSMVDDGFAGAFYVFERSGTAWTETARVTPSDPAPEAYFGGALGMAGDVLVAGAWGEPSAGFRAGAAYAFDRCPAPVLYCQAKPSALGCVPSISSSGLARAGAANGFVVHCSDTRNGKVGILLYGVDGAWSVPFLGGTLCIAIPIHRTPALVSGGNPPPAKDCSGSYAIDMNTFASGVLGGKPDPSLSLAGTTVWCQWLARDAASSFGTVLSDALSYGVCPL